MSLSMTYPLEDSFGLSSDLNDRFPEFAVRRPRLCRCLPPFVLHTKKLERRTIFFSYLFPSDYFFQSEIWLVKRLCKTRAPMIHLSTKKNFFCMESATIPSRKGTFISSIFHFRARRGAWADWNPVRGAGDRTPFFSSKSCLWAVSNPSPSYHRRSW